MNGSNFRSQLRTNIPGDTRISGRFGHAGTVLEGKKFTVSTAASGVHTIVFGTSATNLTPVKGLIAVHAICVVAVPSNTAVQSVVVKSITTSGGAVTGVVLVTTTAAGVPTALASGDMVCFECTVRDTDVLV